MVSDNLESTKVNNPNVTSDAESAFVDFELDGDQQTLPFANMSAAKFQTELSKLVNQKKEREKNQSKHQPETQVPNSQNGLKPTIPAPKHLPATTQNSDQNSSWQGFSSESCVTDETNQVDSDAEENFDGATEVIASPDAFFQQENRWKDANEDNLPKPGEHVSHYEIINEVGRGGFGAVYQVKNLVLGREEALKLILPDTKATCRDADKRFEREINIVSRLEHPNIVRLYSTGQLQHNILWMTMELIRGEQLGIWMDQYGAMPFERAKNIMLQVLSGLQDAHELQIVHRDLKPCNIMISQKKGYQDLAVILDFGLSKAIGSTEDANVQNLTTNAARSIYGTPNYMAPEQFSVNNILTPSVDVYAAGLIFLELLTGVPSYPGSVIEIAVQKRSGIIPIPENLKGTAVEAVIRKACDKLAVLRYKNAGEFYDALSCIQSVTDPPSVLKNAPQKNLHGSRTLPLKSSGDSFPERLISQYPILQHVFFYSTMILIVLILILIGLLIIL